MTKVFSKNKMLARLKAEGRADKIDQHVLEIMEKLDGREAKPNRWRQTVYDENNSWYCTDSDGNQYPVNIDDCEYV